MAHSHAPYLVHSLTVHIFISPDAVRLDSRLCLQKTLSQKTTCGRQWQYAYNRTCIGYRPTKTHLSDNQRSQRSGRDYSEQRGHSLKQVLAARCATAGTAVWLVLSLALRSRLAAVTVYFRRICGDWWCAGRNGEVRYSLVSNRPSGLCRP